MESIIRKAGESDFPHISSLIKQCLPKKGWSEEELLNLANSNGTEILISCQGDECIAYLICRRLSDEAEIISLGTSEEYRNKGIAKSLLNEFLSDHRGKIFLEVAEDNEAAISLYKSLGFEQSGLRKDYYKTDAGRKNAIVMSLRP